MAKKKSKLQLAQEKAEVAVNKTNALIDALGYGTSALYKKLVEIQDLFDSIRNVPEDKRLEYEEIKQIRLEWKRQVEKIENDYNTARAKAAGEGAAGVGAGVAVAALGPTAAMGIATTFGVASTGTAISSLSGAAATNAALAWLGGGALSAGGGGIAAGNALLTLAGPIGWAIAGVALLGSGVLLIKAKSDQNKLESIFSLISERDVRSYELAMVELNERIYRIGSESGQIGLAVERIKGFGLDYDKMQESQQYELGTYFNLMKSSTQLLVNPILGLQPRFLETDYESYCANSELVKGSEHPDGVKNLIITIANLLYKIELDESDSKLFWKSIKSNKEFIESIGLGKKDFKYAIMRLIQSALENKYKLS